jgi:hypothetical protein
MRQTEQEFAARFSSKSVWMKRYVRSTNVYHQPLHFVVESGNSRPGDGTIRTADSDVGIITGGRRWGDAGVKILKCGVAEALQDQILR